MMKTMRTQQKYPETPVRNAPGLHGSVLGFIGPNVTLIVEVQTKDSPHDGWVHVIGPNPPISEDGNYLKTKKPGWVELAHLEDVSSNKTRVTLEIDWDAHTVTLV